MPSPLLLADVPWLLYRSFFALPKSIVGADGHPVNALLGTVNALLAVYEGRLTAQRPRRVVACMGAEQADYRVALYPAYHAHRDPMPPELARQWDKAQVLLESLDWAYSTSAELEADDVMFSHARDELGRGGSALIVSGDRDMFGAVRAGVWVVELGRGGQAGLIGAEQVRERYGVDPEQVPDFIALRGDPSDGLPGAPGIGAKTAADLLRAYGTLEGVLSAAREAGRQAQAGSMRPRIAAAVRDNDELLTKFKEIATLQHIDVQAVADRPTNYAGGARMARSLGMVRLASRLEQAAAGEAP